MRKKITIIGAGISGLAAAFWLNKEKYDLIVLEKNSDAGGTMESVFYDHFLFDRGPNSGLDTTPLIRTLVDEVGLAEELIYANDAGSKRYILRNNELYPLPMGPGALIRSRLFSTKAKLRLLAEPFIGRSDDGYNQSIAQFVKRRLGQEFLDYAINPFVAGVYAGRPEALSVKSAFPKLFRLEEKYGGLIKGMIKGAKERKKSGDTSKQSAKMFSFRKGMQTLPKALARSLGDSVLLNAEVQSIETAEADASSEPACNKYVVHYTKEHSSKQIHTDIVISTVPAYIAAALFRDSDPYLSEHLSSIYYPPVLALFLGYLKKDIGRDLDGFGFLIPEKEKKQFLGAIWSSVIFPERAREDSAAFTLFIGGARSPEVFTLNKKDMINNVINEFQKIMHISTPPLFTEQKMWEKAIPQYNLGYIEHEQYFEKFEKNNPGMFIGGNFRGGISVGDCIKSSDAISRRVINCLKESEAGRNL